MRNSTMLTVLTASLMLGSLMPSHAQTNTNNQPSAGEGRSGMGVRGGRRGGGSSAASVSSPFGPDSTEVKEFNFKGGNFYGFLGAVNHVFGADLMEGLNSVFPSGELRVPPMAVRTARLDDVLNLYNHAADESPGLGRWVITRLPGAQQSPQPNSIQYVPAAPPQTGPKMISVKAFGLRSMSEADRERLMNAISEATGRVLPRGAEDASIMLNKETDILVVSGNKLFLDLVTGMVEAYREDLRAAGVPPAAQFKATTDPSPAREATNEVAAPKK